MEQLVCLSDSLFVLVPGLYPIAFSQPLDRLGPIESPVCVTGCGPHPQVSQSVYCMFSFHLPQLTSLISRLPHYPPFRASSHINSAILALLYYFGFTSVSELQTWNSELCRFSHCEEALFSPSRDWVRSY